MQEVERLSRMYLVLLTMSNVLLSLTSTFDTEYEKLSIENMRMRSEDWLVTIRSDFSDC